MIALRVFVGVMLVIAITFGAYQAGFTAGNFRAKRNMFVRCMDIKPDPFACLAYVEDL